VSRNGSFHDWKPTGIVILYPREKSSHEITKITKNFPSIADFDFVRLAIFIAHNKYHDGVQILTACWESKRRKLTANLGVSEPYTETENFLLLGIDPPAL
jgi:hypothetical protein